MKVEIIKESEPEEATIFIDESENFNFQEKRELKLKEGWYKKSIKIFQCEEAEELTDVSLESIKLLVKKIQVSAVLNCGERIFKEMVKNTDVIVEVTITEERRLLIYTYFDDKLLIYYDK